MKKVDAIIRKSQFDDVKSALMDIKVTFFSYWDVTGVGNEKIGSSYRGVEYSTNKIARRYLSIVISDEFLDRTIKATLDICRAPAGALQISFLILKKRIVFVLRNEVIKL